MSEEMFGTFLGITNQPKRFVRKISGRYVPKVFRVFFSKTSYKKHENCFGQEDIIRFVEGYV